MAEQIGRHRQFIASSQRHRGPGDGRLGRWHLEKDDEKIAYDKEPYVGSWKKVRRVDTAAAGGILAVTKIWVNIGAAERRSCLVT